MQICRRHLDHSTSGADWTVGKSVNYRIKFTPPKKKKNRKKKKKKRKKNLNNKERPENIVQKGL